LEFVVNRETGLIAESTPESLAAAFDSVWENRSEAEAWGRAGRARYESLNLSWANVVRKLLA
jgi:glycosyltransferase involved in cell wall biosynthesis